MLFNGDYQSPHFSNYCAFFYNEMFALWLVGPPACANTCSWPTACSIGPHEGRSDGWHTSQLNNNLILILCHHFLAYIKKIETGIVCLLYKIILVGNASYKIGVAVE